MPRKAPLTHQQRLAAAVVERHRHIVCQGYRDLARDLSAILPLAAEPDPPAPMFTARLAQLDHALGQPGPGRVLTAWEVLAVARRRVG